MSAATAARSVDIVKGVGATSVRDDIQWTGVEATAGSFSSTLNIAAKARGMEQVGAANILILCYGNAAHGIGQPYTQAERDKFLDYVRWVVPRARRFVRYFEVWNEWNHGAGASPAQAASGAHGGAGEYVALCRDAYPIIKSLAPESIVLAGSTSKVWGGHWYPALCDAGLLSACDGLSVHPYTHSEAYPNFLPARVASYLDAIDTSVKAKNNGVSFPQYVTEIGWPTHTAGHSAARVAGMLAHVFRLLEMRDYVKGAWWYDVFDSGSNAADREQRFGLCASNALTPKPAYYAFRAFAGGDRDEWVWCELAMSNAIKDALMNGTLPIKAKRALRDLSDRKTTRTVSGVTFNLFTGPIELSILSRLLEQFPAGLEILSIASAGTVPAQTTVTRDSTWPNGWG